MIVYICRHCKHEISWGAIKCPACDRIDPGIDVAGVIPDTTALNKSDGGGK